MRKYLFLLFIPILLLTGCNTAGPVATEPVKKPGILVEQVEGLPEEFLLGADISSLIALENSGMVYRDFDGREQDLVKTLKDAGLNAIRVRVWKDPYDAAGNGYGGGNCDMEKAIEIGKRAMTYGMTLFVDFHYSDFWADPRKQQPRKAGAGLSLSRRTTEIQSYTTQCLQEFSDAGITVSMVQVGNETTGGFCGEWTVEGQYTLMAAAACAIRSFDPDIQIAVHYTNPEKGGYTTFARRLQDYRVDYDIFASSYYPAWHGTLDNLTRQLKAVAEGYGKQVMVAETAWDKISYDANAQGAYAYSVQGQATAINELVKSVNQIGDPAVGVFYWEPAWIELPDTDWEERSRIWERYGTGWASSYAGEYDPEDAGKYYGGSACVNHALFDENGCPLESLMTFRYLRTGEAQHQPKVDQSTFETIYSTKP